MAEPTSHSFTVHAPIGLHARPVAQIVSLVRESGVDVTLRDSTGKEASAASALRMLAMKVRSGDLLEIIVDSDDQASALGLAKDIEALVNEG